MATPQTDQQMTAEAFADTYPEREDRPAWSMAGADLELWDGVVVEGEVPGFRHQQTVLWLANAIEPWVRAKGGRTWTDADLKIGPRDLRRPDLIAWWNAQPFHPDRVFDAVPNLVIEVVSPQPRDVERDRQVKFIDYCVAGIPHYWIVEPLHRVFEAYHRRQVGQEWTYTRTGLATTGVIGVYGFPNLMLDLDACWAAGSV